jgi:hypothetical protein
MADQAANLALVINEAGRLSDMADKVAGFAISSNLVLVFACLKDIGAWVKTETAAFLGSRLITPTRRPLPRGRLMRQN